MDFDPVLRPPDEFKCQPAHAAESVGAGIEVFPVRN
jgi:hypothetical protein